MTKAKKNVLILGSGAREDSLLKHLKKSNQINNLYITPGNAGSGPHRLTLETSSIPTILTLCTIHAINLVVVGNEQYLIDGITDALRDVGILCFGPSRAASRLEGSKEFAKGFMMRNGVSTAVYKSFDDYDKALNFLVKNQDKRWVLKASGLAAGKGVFLPTTHAEAVDALNALMKEKKFGDAEEYLVGVEVSLLAICDGYTARRLPLVMDHKTIHDNDLGPMTGGMGCVAPVLPHHLVLPADMTEQQFDKELDEILDRTLRGCRKERMPFIGVLFIGLMLTTTGIHVLEYNVRLGDPECQTILPLLSPDVDLLDVFYAACEGYLDQVQLAWRIGFSLTVVVAAEGYPDKVEKGKVVPEAVIKLGDDGGDCGVTVFHAGTELNGDGHTVSNGGRVLAVNVVAEDYETAKKKVYGFVDKHFSRGWSFRRDIGFRLKHDTKTITEAENEEERGGEKSGDVISYKDSGVNVALGNRFIDLIKPIVRTTHRPDLKSDLGGFGAVLDPRLLRGRYVDPLFVLACDGVGAKLELVHRLADLKDAQKVQINHANQKRSKTDDDVGEETTGHEGVGVDLAAMSVNDVLVLGAEPLSFLDYYSSSKLDTTIALSVVRGIAKGCRLSNCVLVGGETAEMPGLYTGGRYDLAGFCVAVVERESVLPKRDCMRTGDVLLGLRSAGLHSNGFSLVRAVLDKHLPRLFDPAIEEDELVPGEAFTVGMFREWLSRDTKIYTEFFRGLLFPADGSEGRQELVLGMAHITGGGIIHNLNRVLPPHLTASVDLAQWHNLVKEEDKGYWNWLWRAANLDVLTLLETWNCGVGMVLVVGADKVGELCEYARHRGETLVALGKLKENEGEANQLKLRNVESFGF